LATGRITNEQFVAGAPRTRDVAVIEVLHQAWFLFSDIRVHRLTGRWALAPDDKNAVVRSILFLQTELEYQWPPALDGLSRAVLFVLTLGLAVAYIDHQWKASGDYDVWPFLTREQYRHALATPRFLSGR
jgi:hypothetical protein